MPYSSCFLFHKKKFAVYLMKTDYDRLRGKPPERAMKTKVTSKRWSTGMRNGMDGT